MPLDWGEFDAIGSADHFTLANASRRLNGLGCDPWQAIDTTKQRLRAKRSRAPRRSV
jgi:DNA primase